MKSTKLYIVQAVTKKWKRTSSTLCYFEYHTEIVKLIYLAKLAVKTAGFTGLVTHRIKHCKIIKEEYTIFLATSVRQEYI